MDRRFTPALFRASYSGRQLEVRRLHPAGVTPCAARGTLFTARVTFRAWPTQARAALFRAHDPTGVRDSGSRGSIIPRPRPCGRGRRTMVRCTARAAGARIVRDGSIYFPRARIRATHCQSDAGARQMRWAGAHRTSRCRLQSRTPWPQRSRTAPAMDEIVARVRSGDGDRSPLIPRARRCAHARPAEGHHGPSAWTD